MSDEKKKTVKAARRVQYNGNVSLTLDGSGSSLLVSDLEMEIIEDTHIVEGTIEQSEKLSLPPRTDEENTLLQRLLARQTRIETRPVMVDGKQGWEHVFTPIKKEQASE